MIKKLIVSFLAVTGIATANAGTDIKDLNRSIMKIMVLTKYGPSVATAFALKINDEKIMVTNNHVCDGFYNSDGSFLIPSQKLTAIPRTNQEATRLRLDKVTEYYMQKGSDICIFKTSNISNYEGLELADKASQVTESIMIAGYVGRSLDLMYVEGRVYGTVPIIEPGELRNCLTSPPKPGSSNALTCNVFPEYPVLITKRLQTAVNNIGPGFSGSPVLQDGKVVGIVSRYFLPANGYSNGDVLFFTLSDLNEAVVGSKDAFVKFSSQEYKKYIKTSKFDLEVFEKLRDFQEDIEETVRNFLKDE